MAEENKEKYSIDFQTNADAAARDVQDLRASIDQTTESTKKSTTATDAQEEGFKSLKTQLREAIQLQQQMSAQYGATSAEAIKATKAVAEIKDEIGFQKDLVESYNPDQKFKALGAATQVAGTGLQGVTAGMALFGGESEDTQKQLLKVQAAMAFSDAISNLSNVADQWAILKTAISSSTIIQKANTAATGAAAIVQNLFTGSVTTTTTGFKALKFAIAATGIGLLVVGLVAVVQNFEKISKWATNLVPGLVGVGDAIGNIVQSVTDFVGVTSEADRAISRMRSNADASLALNKKFLAEHGSQLDEFTKQKIAAKDEYSNAIKEDGANQVALAAELNRKLAAIEYSRGDESRKIAKENAEKAAEEAQKRREKQLADAKKIADEKLAEEKRIADEKLAADMASAREAIKILDELAKEKETPAQKETREFEEKKLVLEANNISTEGLYTSHLAKMTEIERLEREKKTEEENEYWSNEADKAAKRAADEKIISDAKLAQKKSEQDSLAALGNAGINAAKDLFGKNKAVQKGIIAADGAVALGKVAINTVSAVSKDNAASPLTFGMPWSGVHIATGALGAASVIANTTKALQAVGGGSAPSAGAVPSAPSGVSAAPQTGFQASSENQIATSISNQQNQTPIIKTYVVGSEVKTQTDLDAKLIQQNSFG